MKNLKTKIVVVMLMLFISLTILTTNVFAEELKVQIVKVDSTYVIYVNGMLNKDFKYATSDSNLDADSIELSYINAVADENGNNVVILNGMSKYLYVKTASNTSKVELNFDDAIGVDQIAIAEAITNIIPTKAISVVTRDEEIDGVKYEETIGALQIDEEASDATYEFAMEKLPSDKVDALKAAIDAMSEKYNDADMYNKIALAKDLIVELDKAIDNADWSAVEDMVVKQSDDAEDGDVFVILLKKNTDKDTTYDAKVLNSEMTESKPEVTEVTKVIKRTSKLPITGDSLILFGLLFVIIVAIILVAIRMRRIKIKGKH